MLKKIMLSLVIMLSLQLTKAQSINFNKGSWDDMLAKAKTANKLIFADVYAVWCGPCRGMAKNIFTQAKVADKYNTRFINYMVDAEKGEGIKLAEKYQVTGFPTYLFIDDKGNLVYKIEGARPADKFIQEAENALKKFGK